MRTLIIVKIVPILWLIWLDHFHQVRDCLYLGLLWGIFLCQLTKVKILVARYSSKSASFSFPNFTDVYQQTFFCLQLNLYPIISIPSINE